MERRERTRGKAKREGGRDEGAGVVSVRSSKITRCQCLKTRIPPFFDSAGMPIPHGSYIRNTGISSRASVTIELQTLERAMCMKKTARFRAETLRIPRYHHLSSVPSRQPQFKNYPRYPNDRRFPLHAATPTLWKRLVLIASTRKFSSTDDKIFWTVGI